MKKLLLLSGLGISSLLAQQNPAIPFAPLTFSGTALPSLCNNGSLFYNVQTYLWYTCGPNNQWATQGTTLPSGLPTQYLQVTPNNLNSSNIYRFNTLPQIVTSDYSFQQSPGGSIIANSPTTITLTPVPLGVNGTDLGHFVYISGGSGTAEAVKITGGTAVSGATSGTITFTAINNHSGAWTISSKDSGIQEGLQFATTLGGGHVIMPSGVIPIHATVFIPANDIWLEGQGRSATVLSVPAGEFTNSVQWQLYGLNPSGVVIGANVGALRDTISSFSIQLNGASQPSAPNGSYGVEFINSSYCRWTDTEVLGGPVLVNGNTFLPYGMNGAGYSNIVDHNWVYNLTSSISSEGAGGFISGGFSNRFEANYVLGGSNSGYVTGGTDTIFIDNVFDLGSSIQVAGSQAYASDNGVGARFIDNNCVGNGTGPACFSVTTDSTTPNPTDTTFVGNIARNCGQGYQLQSTNATTMRVIISGGSTVGCTVPLSITGTIQNYDIHGVTGLFEGSSSSITSCALTGNACFVNGANQNVPIGTAEIIRTSGEAGPSGAFNIGGFVAQIDGRKLTIINNSGQTMTLNNSDSGSVAANRICTGTGANLTLTHTVANLVYSVLDSCWWVTGQN